MDMQHKTIKSSIQAMKATSEYTLRGKGVVYGGRDLQHETFTRDTDFGASRSFVGMPVYYDHALGGIVSQVGTVRQWQPVDDGIDVEIELDRRHKYVQQVMELVKKGALGLSTGALSHLVEREGSMIKRWIIGEISLTPTPAEPKTFTYAQMAEADAQAGNSAPASTSADIKHTQSGDTTTMDREELKAALVEIAGEPVQGGGVIAAPEAPATKKLTTKGFSNEPMQALMHWLKTGDEVGARQSLKAAMNEGTGSQGGFLVPEDYATQIVDKRDETWIGAKLPVQRYTTSRDIFNIADQDSKSDFAFVAEAGAANFDEPTFTNSAITIYTASLAMKVSNQLLRDEAMDLQGFLAREIGRAYARHLNQYMISGTGSSQPYGILARATVSETLAGAAAVDAADIVNIAHKLPAWYADDSNSVGWIMRNSTLGAIRALQGNFFSFAPTPSGSMESLYGKNVALTDNIAALGATNKPIIFGNMLYYAFVENMGLEISRNPYLYQANYQTGIFTTVRWGGDVTQAEAFVYGVNP
jgi:HK97 family phage major capsid protein